MRRSVPFSFCTCAKTAAIGVLLLCSVWNGPAHADDPFDMEPSSWMSFDRYKEKPSTWVAPEAREAAVTEPVVVSPPTLPPNMPLVTAPTRAIAAPAMPGLNKDFDMHVSTTADDYHLPVMDEPKPDMDLAKESWKDAVQFARNKALTGKSSDDPDDNSPLDVRFTALPAMMSLALKKPAVDTVVKKTEVAEQPKPPVPVTVAQPPAADPAACAAIDAYKKRQLAAIESDRQTLEALQAAISRLGLQKQLNFMTGADGSLKVQDAAAPMDMPAAKN